MPAKQVHVFDFQSGDRHNQPWAPTEDDVLRSMYAADEPWDEMACVLQRTSKGCQQRAHMLGLTKRTVTA